MDDIGVVGLDWRRGGPRELAELSLPAEERGAALLRLAREIGAEELVYLGTCNRVEVAFVCADGAPVQEVRRRVFAALRGRVPAPGEAERLLRAWHGEGAAEHLFLVATGLDSARLGETEIAGQVRAALELSREHGLCGARLEVLFEEALKLSKRARAQTGLGEGRTSLAEIGLDRLRAQLADTPGEVALVGVSPMTERCARELVAEGHRVLVVNRTRARAEELARDLGDAARAVTLEDFRASPAPVVALVSATGAAGALFGAAELDRLRQVGLRLAVDFATDPDVEPEAARELELERFGMEEVLAEAERGRAHRQRESGEARARVDEALERLQGKLARRGADRAIGALRDAWIAKADDQVQRLLDKHFDDLDPERAELLRRFCGRLANHFAHLPASGLRELAFAYGPQVLREFFAHAPEELSRSLGEATSGAQLFAGLAEDPPEQDHLANEGERA